MRWLYDKLSWLWSGSRFPRTEGAIPVGERTPAASSNLQPGELVRVKSHKEILRTITTENKNRGLSWDAEMVHYCGGTYRVLKRVSRIIDEKTGKMQTMKNPCIMLEDVICQARYSACRMFCPRSIYPYWREIWLERVSPKTSSIDSDQQPLAAVSSGCGIDAIVNGDVHNRCDHRGLTSLNSLIRVMTICVFKPFGRELNGTEHDGELSVGSDEL